MQTDRLPSGASAHDLPRGRPSDPTTPATSGGRTRLILGGCVLVGALLRFTGLTTESFWLDEGWLLHVIDRPTLGDVVVAATKDVHPPLSFVLAWGWTKAFGGSDAALRSLSALLGTCAIPAAWALARRLVVPRAALVATAIVALSPLLLRHAHDARQYSLVLLLATISTERALAFAQGGRRATLVGWAIATTLLAYTHVVGVTAVLAQDALLLVGAPRAVRRGKALLGPLAVAHAAVALAVAPWIPYVLDAATRFQGYPGSESPRSLWRAVVAVAGSAKGVAVVFGLALVGFCERWRRRRTLAHGAIAALVLGAIPLVAPWMLSALTTPSFATRLAIHAVPPLAALLGAGLVELVPSRRVALVAALGIVVVGTSLGRLHPRIEREQWREAAALVTAEAKRGDSILALGSPDRHLVRRYVRSAGPRVIDLAGGVPAAVPGEGRLYVLQSVHAEDLSALRSALAAQGWREGPSTAFVLIRVLRFDPASGGR